MPLLFVLLAFFIACAAPVWAYNPPEIIGILTSPEESQQGFPGVFCCVGDQNGDGYDDLVVNQDRFPFDSLSFVYLFNGGENVIDQPAFTWSTYEQGLTIGREMVYLGQVDNDVPRVAFLSVKRLEPYVGLIAADQYRIGPEPSNQPVISMRGINWQSAPIISTSFGDRPKDFNGDGWDDLIMVRQTDTSPYLQAYWGGEDNDSIPDWSVYLDSVPWNSSSAVGICGGFDVNGDEVDDILIHTLEGAGVLVGYYYLFLGGNPPDTIPALRICANDYDLRDVFSLLPDVNGDGYDDWGISWLNVRGIEERSEGGIKVFFGGEEPDAEPDLTLSAIPRTGLEIRGICGGDFNADGIGDIVFTDVGWFGQYDLGHMSIYLGKRWINEQEEPDIYISNMSRVYGYDGAYDIGAVGDYNGDRADDFVAYLADFDSNLYPLGIFAGNRDWRVDVPEEPAIPEKLELNLSVSPNPFNATTTIRYSTPPLGDCELTILDISGREIAQASVSAGDGVYPWTAPESGVYIVRLTNGDRQTARKLVCVK